LNKNLKARGQSDENMMFKHINNFGLLLMVHDSQMK